MTEGRVGQCLLVAAQLLASVAFMQSALAQAPEYPPVFIRSTSGEGQGFAIRNPSGTPRCLVVTAAHVVQAGDRIAVVGLDWTQTAARRYEAPARVREFIAESRLAVLVPAQDLPACPELQLGDVPAAVKSDRVGRTPLVQEVTGEAVHSRVIFEGATASSLQLSSIGARRVEPGFSGGLVTLDGQALGVIQEVDARGVVTASRLDYSRAFVERYVVAPTKKAEGPRRTAWDVSFLPQEYQAVYQAALEIKRHAETAQRVAQANARFAEDAELRATAGSPGHGEITDQWGTYRGQVNAANTVVGMGVRRMSSGSNEGDVLLGPWKVVSKDQAGASSSNLVGPGVLRRDANSGNPNDHKLFEGVLNGANYNGRGVLTFNSGDVVYSSWQDGNNDSPMMFFRKRDGFWFSGTAVAGRWHGRGILWNAEGQIYVIGTWKNGELEDNQTKSLTGQ